jgi:hypothetical protein
MPTSAATNWLTEKAPTTQVAGQPVAVLIAGASTGKA